MKVVALCFFALVLANASIVTAGFFTPSPEKHKTIDDNDDVTVNIEKDDDDQKGGFLAKAKEKLKEEEEEEEVHHKFKDYTKEAAEEAVRVATGKAKEKAKETQEMMKDKGKKGLKGVFGFLLSPVLFAGVLHLLGFATAYGMCVWVTFGSNYVLAKALPRQQFAMVQSKMYPVYFKGMATTVGMALVGNVVGQKTRLSPYGLGIFRGFDLLPPLVMVLLNLLYLEPRASKIMSERMKKEKEEGDATATTEGEKKEAVPRGALLGRLNSYSSLLNVATLMALTWHLVHLGHHLHAVC